MGGGASSIATSLKNEKNKPYYKELGGDIYNANKLLAKFREILAIDGIESFFVAKIEDVEEMFQQFSSQPMRLLLLATLVYIERMNTYASSLFKELLHSQKDIFEFLWTMKMSEQWPKRFQNVDHFRAVVLQKNPFIHQTLGRAVDMDKHLEFAMSKILTDMNSFFNVVEMVHAMHTANPLMRDQS